MNDNQPIKSPSKLESWVIRSMILLGVMSVVNFMHFFFKPEFKGYTPLYVLLAITLIYGVLKKFYLWYHYIDLSVPRAKPLRKTYRVDVLTTYFPGEPYEMTLRTLTAIQKITYPHITYLCDEANDEFLKKECERLGVVHVTRDNRIDAKAGNINNALKQATGEICLILDPDHVPEPNFLDVVLPYFQDVNIGYVQVVQAYYNKPHTLVARGAAEQTFQFYGPMMMSMNSYGTVNAIGANCTFRRSALDSIGGHAPGLAEDMHTAMLLHAKGWKSTYVPQLVAKGLVPADLASYYKQQLKWSRGVFELLYSVYPKQFKNFTLRQKIHYATLPLHYLIGFIYLIGFLIPIISLLFSKMPWTGNVIYFAIVALPVALSSLLIRTYIQKWVIEKNDRGFHIIGGLLQIITWWIFILGVVYTFVRKKVPYLPTPKSEEATNIKIVAPNLVIAGISMFAIFYGLNRDLNPFSLIMAFFALLNTLFMFFSVYLATRVTNRNQILRSALERKTIEGLKKIKQKFIDMADYLFRFTRYLALPLLLASLLISWYSFNMLENDKWDTIAFGDIPKNTMHYLGIFEPAGANGISDLHRVRQLENRQNVDFQIISLYVAWGDSASNQLPSNYLREIVGMGASPMITWEPWAEGFVNNDSTFSLAKKRGIFNLILDGHFDDYLKKSAVEIGKLDATVFLRFAHEFDNPSYPWSLNSINSPNDYKAAYRYVHGLFEEMGVSNVAWVWNPWKSKAAIPSTYPGDNYVDWLGVTLLNYGDFNDDGIWYPFDSLYRPFHEAFKKIADKPVMLAEFGSLDLGGNQGEWLQKAFTDIGTEYTDIKAVVLFNSNFDKNFPRNESEHKLEYLNWSIKNNMLDSLLYINRFTSDSSVYLSSNANDDTPYVAIALPKNIRGVNYKKADNWLNNNYTASRDVLIIDFERMKQIGINTINYRSSEIYDYNVLKYSRLENIDVVYSFSIQDTIDFEKDLDRLKTLRQNILSKIEALKDHKNIVGWNLVGETWWNINNRGLSEPDKQRKAYLVWLKELAESIKKIDHKRPLTKEILISHQAKSQISSIQKSGINLDGFGISVDDERYLEDFLDYATKVEIPFIFTSVQSSELAALESATKIRAVFLENWQNQWETGKVKLDGLLDFKGRKTPDFVFTAKNWGDTVEIDNLPEFRILRPAVRFFPKDRVTYTAVLDKEGSWSYPNNKPELELEWHLVKYDAFGDIAAMKKIGNRPTVTIEVPKNYKQYGILLTIAKGKFSKTLKTTLNTPLNTVDSNF